MSVTKVNATLQKWMRHPDISLNKFARKIIFEDNGIGNWQNCNVKHNLGMRVQMVKTFTPELYD